MSTETNLNPEDEYPETPVEQPQPTTTQIPIDIKS